MRSQGRMTGIVVALAVLAGALVAADLLAAGPTPVPGATGGAAANRGPAPGSIRFAEDEGPAASPLPKYRLPQRALLGLPAGIELQLLARRFGDGQGPAGIQYFTSPDGLSGMFLRNGDGLQAKPLLFLARGAWTLLPDRRFQQRDGNGNRLILGAGKAQVFNGAGLQLGALEDPGLGLLYNALLRQTM